MKISLKGFNSFAQLCHERSYNFGWWKGSIQNNIPTKLCLIHSEISEALEGYRKDQNDDKLPHRKMIEVELADAIIRIADLAGRLSLDVEGAIKEKLEYNLSRGDHKCETRALKGGKKF